MDTRVSVQSTYCLVSCFSRADLVQKKKGRKVFEPNSGSGEGRAGAALSCSHLSLLSVCSSTGVLLSGGAEEDAAGLCL